MTDCKSVQQKDKEKQQEVQQKAKKAEMFHWGVILQAEQK